MIVVPPQTTNVEVNLNLPSKEGLNVNEFYFVQNRRSKVRDLIENVGLDYEESYIECFSLGSGNVCAQFCQRYALGNRSIIEDKSNKLDKVLLEHGFKIEAVLMKSINLPKGLYRAIEKIRQNKLSV